MGKFQQIEEQVKDAMKNGSSAASIKQGLLNGGYTEEDIADILSSIQSVSKLVIETPKEEFILPTPKLAEKELMNGNVSDKPKDEVIPETNTVELPVVSESVIDPTEDDKEFILQTENLKPISDSVPKQENVPVVEKKEYPPSTPKISTPISNPFGNTTVGTNVQIQQDPVIQQDETIITEEPVEKKGGGIIKYTIIIILILGIGAGALFGYSKYDPFFLKSKDDVLRSIIINTQERLFVGGYKLEVSSNYDAEYEGLSIKMDIPVSYEIEDVVDGKFPNQSINIGDVDLAPLFSALNQMFMGFFADEVEEGATEEIVVEKNSILNIGLKYSDGLVYLILNKVPDELVGFMPVNQFLGTWISFGSDDVEGLTGYDTPEANKEELQKNIDEIIDVMLVKAEPEINIIKEDDSRRVTYKAPMNKIMLALYEIDSDSEYRDEIIEQTERIEGDLYIEFLIGNDFIVREFNISFDGEDPEEMTKGVLSISGSFDLNGEVSVTVPESFITSDEVEEMIMMEMMEGMESYEDVEYEF